MSDDDQYVKANGGAESNGTVIYMSRYFCISPFQIKACAIYNARSFCTILTPICSMCA